MNNYGIEDYTQLSIDSHLPKGSVVNNIDSESDKNYHIVQYTDKNDKFRVRLKKHNSAINAVKRRLER